MFTAILARYRLSQKSLQFGGLFALVKEAALAVRALFVTIVPLEEPRNDSIS